MKTAISLLAIALCGTTAMAMVQKEQSEVWNPARSMTTSSNGVIQVNVANADEPAQTGRFTIGMDDGRRLLYGHGGSPWSTYIRMRVDGMLYAPGDNGGTYDDLMTLVDAPTLMGDGSITTSWSVGEVMLTQILQPVMLVDQATVRIEYQVALPSGASAHELGLLLELDTMVNGNDAAPILTDLGYGAVETCMSDPVPAIWQAFEQDPTQPDSLLIACGQLEGNGAVPPDMFAIGAWGALYNGTWDYACSGSPYGDSGALLQWDLGTMTGGESTMVRTYYGSCGVVTSEEGDLTLTLGGVSQLSCEGEEWSPNPFPANVIVSNTGTAVCEDVMVEIIPAPGLTVVGSTLIPLGNLAPGIGAPISFALSPDGTICDQYLLFSVEVVSATCEPAMVQRRVWVPCCDVASADEQPLAYDLRQNYPNPFNPTTSIEFELEDPGFAKLSVFDVSGRSLVVLANGLYDRGSHSFTFDGTGFDSGIYFYSLETAAGVQTRKMVLVK